MKEEFPYDGFPYRLEHKDGSDNKVCWFSCQEHLQKYIERYKPIDGNIQTVTGKATSKKQQLFSNLDTFFESNESPEIIVAPVGTRTRRKSSQKRPSSRQSSSS